MDQLVHCFLVYVFAASWHSTYSRDFRDNACGNWNRKFTQVFESNERYFLFSLQEIHIFFIRILSKFRYRKRSRDHQRLR